MRHKFLATIILVALFLSCQNQAPSVRISLENPLDFNRSEVVAIPIEQIKDKGVDFNRPIVVLNSQQEQIPFQLVTNELLVNTDIAANGTLELMLSNTEDSTSFEFNTPTYSRFVPERIDDYAWENNRVAFRTYGPEAQRLKENNEKGGTLSSGFDGWLKRVEYPIINKWYQNFVNGKTYHQDYGEGLDNYHVGTTRGIGGIGIFNKDSLYTSKNFVNWKTLYTGPLRTQFELEYAAWGSDNFIKKEVKRITLDHNSNLMKVEVALDSETTINSLTLGIAINDNNLAESMSNTQEGWHSIWAEHFDSQLGTAVLLDPQQIEGVEDYRVAEKDQSHLFINTTPNNNSLVYYAGFGWVKSGQFNTKNDWELYLNQHAQGLKNPILITIN